MGVQDYLEKQVIGMTLNAFLEETKPSFYWMHYFELTVLNRLGILCGCGFVMLILAQGIGNLFWNENAENEIFFSFFHSHKNLERVEIVLMQINIFTSSACCSSAIYTHNNQHS